MLAVLLASITFPGGRALYAQAPVKSSVESDKPGVDSLGDPLPAHALARWGTARLHHPDCDELEFSPNGKVLATTGMFDTVLWDVESGKELRSFTGGSAVFFHDGLKLATLETDGTIHIWDCQTGQEVRRFKPPARLAIMAVSQDGKRVITRERRVEEKKQIDMIVELDAETGKELKAIRLIQGPDDRMPQSIVVSRNGLYFAVQDDRGAISIWETASGKKLYRIPRTQGPRDQYFALSPDGASLAFTTFTNEGRIFHFWDVPGNKDIKQMIMPKLSGGMALFSADGKTLYTNGATAQTGSRVMMICDLAEGKVSRTLRGSAEFLNNQPLPVAPNYRGVIGHIAMAVSADNRYLATFDAYGSVRIWDIAKDKSLHIWDIAKDKSLHTLSGPRQGVRMVGLSADEKVLLCVDGARKLRTFDLATGKELRVYDVPSNVALFSADGLGIEIKGGNQFAMVDLANVARRYLLIGRSSFPHDISLGPDNEVFKSLGVRDTRFWRISPVAQEVRYLPTRWNEPFQTNGDSIVTVDQRTGRLTSWDGASGECICESTPKSRLFFLSKLSPDGRSLVVGGSLIEVASGTERVKMALPMRGKVPEAQGPWLFSPDGRWLLVGSGPKMLILDATSGTVAGELGEHRHSIAAAAISRDGARLFTGSDDIMAWDLAAVTRKTKPQATKLSEAEVASLWKDLASSDAPRAYQAMWRLADDPMGARHVADGLKRLDYKRLSRFIRELDSDEFEVRERASQELERLGAGAVPSLRRVLEGKPSVEVRNRATKLLNKLAPQGAPGSTDDLLMHRVIEVLEHIGTPEAVGLLKDIAQGEGARSVLLDAKLTLNRLARD
jgi:WD40 repeat protein